MSRFAYILVCIALYSAATFALTWALWQVVPEFVAWAQGKIGAISANIIMLIFPFACWGLFYLFDRNGSGPGRKT